ncbi:Uncharacterized protein HZ326_28887 [Fusarium oxysporum f. sp. albedinis]|nr:Uncharacterized protein HZ326_28887 [Fusarium oxysporum f. sp. albedinis]
MVRVWPITGSSRGVGRVLAEKVLELGDIVIATTRNPSQFDDLITNHQYVAVEMGHRTKGLVVHQVQVELEFLNRSYHVQTLMHKNSKVLAQSLIQQTLGSLWLSRFVLVSTSSRLSPAKDMNVKCTMYTQWK